ncbi:MAG: type II secretion system GspH family protein [Planctomycetota bacterium]|nr:type II secretion system GspH family protein [Planctomycetota bacterium]
MTLIELLLVLAILAMLAGLLVSSADTMMDRARVDETERRGQAVVQAICGEGGSMGRFLADLGRPPLLVSLAKGKQLSELWSQEGSPAGAYGEAATTVDWGEAVAGVAPQTLFKLPCGWRGPYLQISGDTFYDGWPEGGWSLFLSGWGWVDPDPNAGSMPAAALGSMILKIRSLGADKAAGGGEWMDAEREYPAHADFLTASADLTLAIYFKPPGEERYRPAEASDEASPSHLRAALILPIGNRACYVRLRWAESEWEFWKEHPELPAELRNLLSGQRIAFGQVKVGGIIPGPRLVYAYGFRQAGAQTAAFYASPFLMHLKPGDNEVALYLQRKN